jgi:hypothetical protein
MAAFGGTSENTSRFDRTFMKYCTAQYAHGNIPKKVPIKVCSFDIQHYSTFLIVTELNVPDSLKINMEAPYYMPHYQRESCLLLLTQSVPLFAKAYLQTGAALLLTPPQMDTEARRIVVKRAKREREMFRKRLTRVNDEYLANMVGV